MPSAGPRASISGFHNVAQCRRLDALNWMRTATGADGNGAATLRLACLLEAAIAT
jgi:hypothetical protein